MQAIPFSGRKVVPGSGEEISSSGTCLASSGMERILKKGKMRGSDHGWRHPRDKMGKHVFKRIRHPLGRAAVDAEFLLDLGQ